MAENNFDLESLVHVEQTFFDSGYQDGYEHGRTHGLIEGKALGRDKGYEMWEELGFYEGFASTWKEFLQKNGAKDDDRVLNSANRLLELIAQFPKINPSSEDQSSDLDISQLLSRIRSRYKVLCSSIGVRPTLRATMSDQSPNDQDAGDRDDSSKEPRPKVWPILSQLNPSVTNQDLSY